MERGSLRIKTQDSVHTSTLEANAKKSICLTSVTNLKLKYSVTWKGGVVLPTYLLPTPVALQKQTHLWNKETTPQYLFLNNFLLPKWKKDYFTLNVR